MLANRLSADPEVQVVVLEAGPRDNNPFVHIPAGFAQLMQGPRDWNYRTEPQPTLAGRSIYWPRGKMLGGSSSMNAMMWVRGFAADYDEWGEYAGDEWDYAHLRPYLQRIEAGPLVISDQRSPRSSTAAWLTAVQQCGYRIDEPNSDEPQGFCETRVNQRRGLRWSTAAAYLKPVRRRKNLTVLTEATATRVVFAGNRAIGVEYDGKQGPAVVTARREVVLCAGAINSPQLLMLSGVGDHQQLAAHGIPTVAHSPQVGANLLDHLVVPLGFDVPGDSLLGAQKPLELVNYLLRRRGMLTSNAGEAYGFVKSRPDLALPDLELIFAPAPYFDEAIGDPYTDHAVVMGPILLKPRSSGTITLRSANPHDKPIIDPRYLSDDADREALLAGLRICVDIAKAPALRDIVGRIARPLDCTELNDDTLVKALETNSHTLYHPVGTCRMGSDDASVVDPQLRVRGVTGLRVADASVMPTIIRGHTHAPTVLIGEKAADLIAASRPAGLSVVPSH